MTGGTVLSLGARVADLLATGMFPTDLVADRLGVEAGEIQAALDALRHVGYCRRTADGMWIAI